MYTFMYVHVLLINKHANECAYALCTAQSFSADLFLQINLVYSIASKAWIRACTHCDLLIINKKDVLRSLRHFPSGMV